MTHAQAMQSFKALMLVDQYERPIPFKNFKNISSIHRYGNKYKVLYVGHPKKNLWGFFLIWDNDMGFSKEAYKVFVKTVAGDMSFIEDKELQHGNAGIPISYGDLRTTYPKKQGI